MDDATSLPVHAASADAEDALGFTPVAVAYRADGWTAEKQRAFIEELADCGIVREAAARVGMTEQSAHRLRRRPDAAAFNRAWDAAMRLGAGRLHSIALERAIEGTIRRRYFQGEVVGEERVYDNRLLLNLLGRLPDPYASSFVSVEDWPVWMNAVADGVQKPLPAPDAARAPVWRDDDGRWLTSFPPPEDFEGGEWCGYGEEDYCRQLSPSEEAAVEAWERGLSSDSHRQRDLYFRRLSGVPVECQAEV